MSSLSPLLSNWYPFLWYCESPLVRKCLRSSPRVESDLSQSLEASMSCPPVHHKQMTDHFSSGELVCKLHNINRLDLVRGNEKHAEVISISAYRDHIFCWRGKAIYWFLQRVSQSRFFSPPPHATHEILCIERFCFIYFLSHGGFSPAVFRLHRFQLTLASVPILSFLFCVPLSALQHLSLNIESANSLQFVYSTFLQFTCVFANLSPTFIWFLP